MLIYTPLLNLLPPLLLSSLTAYDFAAFFDKKIKNLSRTSLLLLHDIVHDSSFSDKFWQGKEQAVSYIRATWNMEIVYSRRYYEIVLKKCQKKKIMCALTHTHDENGVPLLELNKVFCSLDSLFLYLCTPSFEYNCIGCSENNFSDNTWNFIGVCNCNTLSSK